MQSSPGFLADNFCRRTITRDNFAEFAASLPETLASRLKLGQVISLLPLRGLDGGRCYLMVIHGQVSKSAHETDCSRAIFLHNPKLNRLGCWQGRWCDRSRRMYFDFNPGPDLRRKPGLTPKPIGLELKLGQHPAKPSFDFRYIYR